MFHQCQHIFRDYLRHQLHIPRHQGVMQRFRQHPLRFIPMACPVMKFQL